MIEPWQLYVDVNGTSWVLVKELQDGFFWLALRVSYLPKLALFSVGNLRRMHCVGQLTIGG